MDRNCVIDGKYLIGVQVAKSDSVFYLEELSLYQVQGKYYVVQHDKDSLPSFRDIVMNRESDYWKIQEVDDMIHYNIHEAILFYKEHKKKNLAAYSTIVTYCLLQGVDLIGMGILEV